MAARDIIVVGGGAAGFFAAITCAEASRESRVLILEKGSRFLDKVRISGGGRCNVTHEPSGAREFTRAYPRGADALLEPLQRFSAEHTIEWFRERGVTLKTESDGRLFPVTDRSATIVDCLMRAATRAGIDMRLNQVVTGLSKRADGRFDLAIAGGERLDCDRVLLATGGCRAISAGRLAGGLGHALQPPVPSLFSFHIDAAWLRALAGVSVPEVEVHVPAARLRERGPVLITHWGLSGPAILRLSAWAARDLHRLAYQFQLRVNWLPGHSAESIGIELQRCRELHPSRRILNTPVGSLPARLWEQLALAAGIPGNDRWASLSRRQAHELTRRLTAFEFTVSGKSLNRDEFVTCGGVSLKEVNFRTMESRVCPGLFLAGELLDLDGITGGYNFQAAWTTGFIAGRALAARSEHD